MFMGSGGGRFCVERGLILSLLLLVVTAGLMTRRAMPRGPHVLVDSSVKKASPSSGRSMTRFLVCGGRFSARNLVSSPSFKGKSGGRVLQVVSLCRGSLPALRGRVRKLSSPTCLHSVAGRNQEKSTPCYNFTSTARNSS